MLMENPTWRHNDPEAGKKRLEELLENGVQVKHRFYTEEEIMKNPDKEETALYYFPAKGDAAKAPFVAIAPGGAYEFVADELEGFPIAAKLNDMGYNAFVVHYRTGEAVLEQSIEDLTAALKYIFANAKGLNVSEKDYGLMGFSAGGHLVSLALTNHLKLWEYQIPYPKTLMLCYPLQDFYNGGRVIDLCRKCAFGTAAKKEEVMEAYVPENLVKREMNVYLWQTKEDEIVPFKENGYRLYEALKTENIPVKFRIVEHGPHGLGIAKDTEAEGWLEEAVAYWRNV